MDEYMRKMVEVADNPRGAWGRKMLEKMNTGHMKLINWGFENIDMNVFDRILDIGCGSGNSLAMMYAENQEAYYEGIDISEVSVKAAKENNVSAIRTGHMNVRLGNVTDVPYAAEIFDLAVTVESFYYWKEYDKAMDEVARVLKPTGKFLVILEAHGDSDDPERHKEITDILKDMYIPGEADFRKIFSAAGFEAEIKKSGDWIKVLGVKVRKQTNKDPFLTKRSCFRY